MFTLKHRSKAPPTPLRRAAVPQRLKREVWKKMYPIPPRWRRRRSATYGSLSNVYLLEFFRSINIQVFYTNNEIAILGTQLNEGKTCSFLAISELVPHFDRGY